MAENRSLLTTLCTEKAFIGFTCYGIDFAESIVWEELELADDAITGRPFSAVDVEHYTPLTLAAYVREYGPGAFLNQRPQRVVDYATRQGVSVSLLLFFCTPDSCL